MSDTPRTDALTTALYHEACADAAAMPGIYATERSPEECYGMAVDLAKTLERELAAAARKLEEAERRIELAVIAAQIRDEDLAERQQQLNAALEQRNQHLKREQALEQQLADARIAIDCCLKWSGGREDEWGERAINAFSFLQWFKFGLPLGEAQNAMLRGALEASR